MIRTRLSWSILFFLFSTVATGANEPPSPGTPESAVSERIDSAPGRELLIRFELSGGMWPFQATALPRWSLYADGLVVWTRDGEPTPGFIHQVWIGHLADDEVRELVRFAESIGFWSLDDDYAPSHEISADGKTVQLSSAAAPDQLSSSLNIHSGSRFKRVTVYPADWQGAPDAYVLLRDRLLETETERAAEFAPQSFRLEVRCMPSADRQRGRPWPFEHLDLTTAETGVMTLSRDDGLEVDGFLRAYPPAVEQTGRVFSLRLLADPPRGW